MEGGGKRSQGVESRPSSAAGAARGLPSRKSSESRRKNETDQSQQASAESLFTGINNPELIEKLRRMSSGDYNPESHLEKWVVDYIPKLVEMRECSQLQQVYSAMH